MKTKSLSFNYNLYQVSNAADIEEVNEALTLNDLTLSDIFSDKHIYLDHELREIRSIVSNIRSYIGLLREQRRYLENRY